MHRSLHLSRLTWFVSFNLFALGVGLVLGLGLGDAREAIAQTTQPADPQPARPCLGTFAAVMAQGGMAPCTLHVDATELPLAHGRALTAMYEWDFGDPIPPPAATTTTAPPTTPADREPSTDPQRPAPFGPNLGYNRIPGWNAAHVYNGPGTYTVTLKITDEAGEVRTYSRTINVLPDTRPLRRVRSYAELKAAAQAKVPGHVLVEQGAAIDYPNEIRPTRGTIIEGLVALLPPPPPPPPPSTMPTTFPSTSPTTSRAPDRSPILPTLRWTAGKRGLFFVGEDFLIRNLAFTSNSTADDRVANVLKAYGQNTVEWCTFDQVWDCVNGETNPRYVLVKDCRDVSDVSVKSYLAWVQGADWVIAGNTIHNSTRAHCIRCGGAERVNICFNDLTNIGRESVDKYDQARQTITAHLTGHIGIYDNLCRVGRVEIGPLGQGDGVMKPNFREARLSCVQIIGNRFDFSSNNRLEIDHGCDGVYIAGNWIRTPSRDCIHVEDPDPNVYTVKGVPLTYGGRNVNDVIVRPDNTLITRAGDRPVYVSKAATNVRNEMAP